MDDIKDWTGRNVEELLRLAENRLEPCGHEHSVAPMPPWLRDMMMMLHYLLLYRQWLDY